MGAVPIYKIPAFVDMIRYLKRLPPQPKELLKFDKPFIYAIYIYKHKKGFLDWQYATME